MRLSGIGCLAVISVILSIGIPEILLAANQPDLKWNRDKEPYAAVEKRTVDYIQAINASEIEKGLPNKPLGQWIEEILGNDVKWGINDCGEGGDREGPVPVCASIEKTFESLFLYVAVGDSDGTVSNPPQFFFGGMKQGDKDYRFKKLIDVPKALEDSRKNETFYKANPLKQLSLNEATTFVNNTFVKQIDAMLPNQKFGEWLKGILPPGTEQKWDLDGCDGRGLQPQCLVSVNRLPNESSVLITIGLENRQRGLNVPPYLQSVSFYKVRDRVRNYSSLSEFEKDFQTYLSTTTSQRKK